jgi:hypothetical protein
MAQASKGGNHINNNGFFITQKGEKMFDQSLAIVLNSSPGLK